MLGLILSRIDWLFLRTNQSFLDFRRFANTIAQVIQLGSANLTFAYDLDLVDSR